MLRRGARDSGPERGQSSGWRSLRPHLQSPAGGGVRRGAATLVGSVRGMTCYHSSDWGSGSIEGGISKIAVGQVGGARPRNEQLALCGQGLGFLRARGEGAWHRWQGRRAPAATGWPSRPPLNPEARPWDGGPSLASLCQPSPSPPCSSQHVPRAQPLSTCFAASDPAPPRGHVCQPVTSEHAFLGAVALVPPRPLLAMEEGSGGKRVAWRVQGGPGVWVRAPSRGRPPQPCGH